MSEFDGTLARIRRGDRKRSRFRPWVMLVVPLGAILFQVYVPLYFSLLQHLELPLLVTVYLGVARRNVIEGALIGASIGLVQDSLSFQPIGIFGMIKTLLGYASASLGIRLDTGHPAIRFGLGTLAFLCHQSLYWLVRHVLLGAPSGLDLIQTVLAALFNGALAVPLFYLLDKLREEG
jgi:rod shape-determining protein MreD